MAGACNDNGVPSLFVWTLLIFVWTLPIFFGHLLGPYLFWTLLICFGHSLFFLDTFWTLFFLDTPYFFWTLLIFFGHLLGLIFFGHSLFFLDTPGPRPDQPPAHRKCTEYVRKTYENITRT